MSGRRALDEAKKGSAEIVILAIVEDESHHGYEIAKLIEERTGGSLKFARLALRDALSPRRSRLDQGPVGGKGRPAPPLLLPDYRRGPARTRRAARRLEPL